MPSTYSNLKIELIATGEQSGTWGATTNTNLGTAIEEAITGSADVTFTNGNDTTITLTDTNAAQAARNLRLNLIGSSTGAQNLILGSGCQIEKLYLINNTLGHTITVKNTTGTGIAVPAGRKMVVYNDGTNVVNAVDYFSSLNVDITGGTINNTVIGGTTPAAGTFTQVNIPAQGDLRLEDTTGGEYVALQAPGTLASSYTLTFPVDDGTNGQALITDGSGNLSWSTAASGDVYGPASATDNAIARFDLTTGKLIQNSSALVDDAGNVLAGAGLVGAPAFSTTGDTNTGIFFPAADTIAFTEGGVEAMRIDSAGNVGIGATSLTGFSFSVSKGLTGATTVRGIQSNGDIKSDVTTAANMFLSFPSVANAAFTLSSLRHYHTAQNTIGALASVTNQFGFFADSSLTGATNNYGFYSNIASGTGRWNFYANGTADNYFAGKVGVGAVPLSFTTLNIGGNAPDNSFTAMGVASRPTVAGTATVQGIGFGAAVSTADTASVTPIIRSFFAEQGTITGGSRGTVGNQYGFFADSTLTGATNNYGFFSNIASGSGRWNFYANGTADNFFGGNTTISVNTSGDALRITQVGSGNALVVEDSANPDATPFVINASGQVVVGNTTAVSDPEGAVPSLQVLGIDQNTTRLLIGRYSNGSTASNINLIKSRGTTINSNGILLNGDTLGVFRFFGNDGSANIESARITAEVDGTPGTNDMPGRLVFSTTADGASSPTERMRIDSAGQVGIGGTPSAGQTVLILKNATGATTARGIRNASQIQSDVTSAYQIFQTSPTTAAASFTLTNLSHFDANQGLLGASSAITNQFGFLANSSLTGATNNFGFYSNIASGSGRWNFYANGTADNYFAGSVGIGAAPNVGLNLRIAKNVSGSTFSSSVYADGVIQSDVTARASSYISVLGTAAASFTVTNMPHYGAFQGTIGASSTVTNQYGYFVDSSLIGATNNYGFYSNIASGSNRWNFYANGTAANYFAGQTLIGSTTAVTDSSTASRNFQVTGTTGAAAGQYIGRYSNDVNPSALVLGKSRGTSVGTNTVVASGDTLGRISFDGADGTNLIVAATIQAEVDGTPGTNDMPGRLVFSTTADGAAGTTERMRIDSSGRVLVNGTTAYGTTTVSQLSNTGASAVCAGFNHFFSNTKYVDFLWYGASIGSIENLSGLGVGYYVGANTGMEHLGTNTLGFKTNNSERMRITSDGNVLVGSTIYNDNFKGILLSANGRLYNIADNAVPLNINRLTTDGTLVDFKQDNTIEGNISVSGTTVSYNGGHLSRWSQLPNNQKDDTLLKGTVMSNLDDMCIWVKDGETLPNEQLNKMKVSDVEGDTNVAGVFVNWTFDEQCQSDDMNVAMTGDMIIRIAEGVAVQKGDLLMSAGDGTAKPQGDDIVRSKTIAKVTSNHVTCTYADGSYCVPCVLMAC